MKCCEKDRLKCIRSYCTSVSGDAVRLDYGGGSGGYLCWEPPGTWTVRYFTSSVVREGRHTAGPGVLRHSPPAGGVVSGVVTSQ